MNIVYKSSSQSCYFLFCAGCCALCFKKTLEIKYVLSWIIIDICLLIIDLFPPILSFLSELLGVQLPSNMIFLVAIILLFLLVFSHTVLLSRLMETNKTLTQEIALLKKEMDEIKKQH